MRYVVTAVVRLLEIEAKLVLIDDPLATLLHTERNTSQRAIAFINKTIMDLVGELHPRKLCPDLRTRQFLQSLRGDKASIEGNQAPDARSECRDEALQGDKSQFSVPYFLH